MFWTENQLNVYLRERSRFHMVQANNWLNVSSCCHSLTATR
jgi:hypothetical protein